MNQQPLSLYPLGRDLLGHSIAGNQPPVVTFDYGDCTRTYNGAQWTVTPKPPTTGLFRKTAKGLVRVGG